MNSLIRALASLLVGISFMIAGAAMAQAEPSMSQIYAAAQAGKVDEAQVMVQQVLISHPKSAKAHFVQAEMYARRGRPELALESLALAEKYAPGLPFAKPEAVQALRAQLSAKPARALATKATALETPAPSTTSSALPLLLAGGVIAAGYFFFRRRTASPSYPPYADGSQSGLSGPQSFGTGSFATPPSAYPQGVYPQAYPAPGETSLGGKIMGGVATGLAVGAGVMAAQAIGRNLMGHSNEPPRADNQGDSVHEPVAPSINADMGGNNFGIADTSWDDAGSGGGSDWDS